MPAWIDMVAYALLHSVWQFLLLGAFLWLALKILPVQLARLRHNMALFCLYLMPVLFVATCMHFLSIGAPQTGKGSSVVQLNLVAPAVTFVWGLGVLFTSARLVWHWRAISRLANEPLLPVPPEIEAYVRHMARHMKIGRKIRIGISGKVEGPCTFAFWKPVILISASCIASLSVAEMEAVIAHELAHIKRLDALMRIIQSVLEALFFYHPVAAFISRQVSLEREHICDDMAVEAIGDPKSLAKGLLKAGIIRSSNALILAANSNDVSSLERRIGRIVSIPKSTRPGKGIGSEIFLPRLVPLIAVGLFALTAVTSIEKANASMFTRPMLIELKDDACDQIKEAQLYDNPEYYQGGPATLHMKNNMVMMNNVILPQKTQIALRQVFREHRLADYPEVKLRYLGADVKLVLKPETGNPDNALHVFKTKPYSLFVSAFRLPADA